MSVTSNSNSVQLMASSTGSRLETLQRIESLPIPDDQKEDLIAAVRNLQRRGKWKLIDAIREFPWGVFSKEKPNVGRARAILEGFIPNTYNGNAFRRIAEYAIVLSKDPNTRLRHLHLYGFDPLFLDMFFSLIGDLLGRPVQKLRFPEETKSSDVMDSLVNALRTAKCCNPAIVVDLFTKPKYRKAHRILVRRLRRELHKTFVDRRTGMPIDLSNVLFVFVHISAVGSLSATEEDFVGLVKTSVLPPLLTGFGLEEQRYLLTDTVLRMIVGKTRASDVLEKFMAQDFFWVVPNSSANERMTVLVNKMFVGKIGDDEMIELLQLERQNFDGLLIALLDFLNENRKIVHPSAVINVLRQQGCIETSFCTVSVKPLQSRKYLPVGYATVLGIDHVYVQGWMCTVQMTFSRSRSKTKEQRQMIVISYNYCRNNASRYGISMDVLETPFTTKWSRATGLSMGCSVFRCLFSLYTNRRVRTDSAVSGVITLSGRICPIGDVNPKTNAAYRWGARRMVFPSGNRVNVEREVDEMHKREMEFIYIDTLDELVQMFTHIRRLASSASGRLSRVRSLQTRATPAAAAVSHTNQYVSLRRYSQETPSAQKFEFQAETRNLLDIVAKSLYSDQEVFVRELISNASDALEKRRCSDLTKDTSASVLGDEIPYEIRITTNAETNEMSFEDTGIGMNREELISCLGTIAKSGSKDFKTNSESKSAESIIGQFGVGFYSAFMVADSVKVTTRKENEPTGYTWTWDGASAYEISENSSAPVGTKIDLKLRTGDAAEFSKAEKVLEVINKYSYFVTVPIILNGERVNSLNAIWTMTPKDVTSEMHESFFKQLARTHHPHLMHDRPQYTIHYKADAPVNLRSILYIPSHKVSQLEFTANSDDSGVSLYARKVLIKAHAKELLPAYLRFVIGVVDSEDIPLNLSREMLQRDVVLVKLRRILTDKVVGYLVQQMKKDRIKYNEFYNGYSLYFKEGICLEQDQGIKEQISKMLLFESSNMKPGTMTSLSEYVERMQTDQKDIYYMFAPSRQLAESSPYFEMFKSKNLEVLFVYDPADELVFLSLPQFEMKQLKSVENWVKTEGGLLEDKKEENVIRSAEKKEFLDWVKNNLGSVRVNDIDSSSRASEHPAMITTGAADLGAARHLMRIGQIKDMEHLVYLKPKLHINLNHAVIQGLLKLRKSDEKLALMVLEQIYDNALITAGLMKDSSKMISRVNRIMGDLMNQNKSTILTP